MPKAKQPSQKIVFRTEALDRYFKGAMTINDLLHQLPDLTIKQLSFEADKRDISIHPRFVLKQESVEAGGGLSFTTHSISQQEARIHAEASAALVPNPIVIISHKLHCPHCGARHLDEDRNGEKWNRRAHTTHRCQDCGGDFDVFVSGS